MKPDEIYAKYINKPVETVDPNALNQCFDWALRFVMDAYGLPINIFPWVKNATDMWIVPQQVRQALVNFDFIENRPDNFPNEGDIVIFGNGVNHVVVAAKGCTTGILKCYSENDPIGSPVIYKEYPNYNHVLGWLHFHPQLLVGQAEYGDLVKKSTHFDDVATYLGVAVHEWGDVKTALDIREAQAKKDHLQVVEDGIQLQEYRDGLEVANIKIKELEDKLKEVKPAETAQTQPEIKVDFVSFLQGLKDTLVMFLHKYIIIQKGEIGK